MLPRRKSRRDRAYWLYQRGDTARLRRYYSRYYKQFQRAASRGRGSRSVGGAAGASRGRGSRSVGGAEASRGRGSRSVGGAAECRSCGLLLVADHSFYQSVGERSVRQTVLQVSRGQAVADEY